MEVETTIDTTTVFIKAADLLDLATTAVFATNDMSRYILQAVRLEVGAGTVVATATDSYRLVMMTRDTETEGSGTYLVPATWLATVAKAVKSSRCAGVVTLTLTERNASAHYLGRDGESSSSTPLIEGKYPDLSQIIDKWEPETKPGEFGLNPTFLADFAKLAPFNTKRTTDALRIEIGKDRGPVKLSGPGFTAYQMPVAIR